MDVKSDRKMRNIKIQMVDRELKARSLDQNGHKKRTTELSYD